MPFIFARITGIMKDLYVMRHGETEWNTQKRYQGQLNSPLTERGSLKLKEQKEVLPEGPFTKVYCSPLGRCRQTLEILNPPAHKICFDDRLMEFHLGVLQGKTHDQVSPRHQEQQKILWENPEHFNLEGAESFDALEERVSELLKEVCSQEGPILLISHTIIIKMIFKVLEGRELRNFWDKPFLFPGTLLHFKRGNHKMVLEDVKHPEGMGAAVKAYTA